jgi:hypothetical protein
MNVIKHLHNFLFQISIMKRINYSIAILLVATITSFQIKAQMVEDSVTMTTGYAEEVYYSLENGFISSAVRADWEISFYTLAYSSGIRINGGSGTQLYAYPKSDTSGWASVDTSGLSNWPQLMNSEAYWEEGAFAQNSLGHPDYGWGIYNMITHNLTGDSLFIVKLINGTFKKLWIVGKQSMANIYTFRYADLDGNNDTTIILDCNPYGDKNFIYYSLENNTIINREPLNNSWDILFTKYMATQPQGGYYNVAGVLTNNDVMSVRLEGVDPEIEDWHSYTFSDSIGNIGFDWKYFDMGSFQYFIVDSMVYFIRTLEGNVYKLMFTGFDGSSTGNIYFTKKMISAADVEEVASIDDFAVYPNPANEFVNIDINTKELTQFNIQIVDLLGHIVYKEDNVKNNGSLKIPTQNWNSGLYLISVNTADSSITKKILIDKH